MSKSQILIVTPHSDFGDIVSQSLDNEASGDVKVATSSSEAYTHAKKSRNLNYALLDMEMGVEKVLEQGFSLRNAFPSISLILISKKYPPTEMEDLRPWKFLKKPFVQKELLDLIHDGKDCIYQNSGTIDLNFQGVVEDTVPAWFFDEGRATKNLVAAISNLVVQEAILVSDTNILAYSGELPTEAVEECSMLVRKYWGKNNTAELIKPVRLKTTSKEHLLSATIVAVGIILALTFDSETPFDIMRSQTRYLTKVLKNPQLASPDIHILPNNPEVQAAKKPMQLASLESVSIDLDKNRTESNVSFPDPQVNRSGGTEEETSIQQDSPGLDSPWHSDPNEDRNIHAVQMAKEDLFELEKPPTWTNLLQPQKNNHYEQSSYLIPESRPVENLSTQTARTESSRGSYSPINPSLFDAYYACVIVPRIRTHALDGDCADYLRREIPNIFLAYGWRLDELIIDQTYLQWLVRIPPTIAPASHINVIRKESSKMILSNFSRFNRNEFLRDFWSPGYLLGCGQRLIPTVEIADFIKMNRKQYYSEENPLRETSRDILNLR